MSTTTTVGAALLLASFGGGAAASGAPAGGLSTVTPPSPVGVTTRESVNDDGTPASRHTFLSGISDEVRVMNPGSTTDYGSHRQTITVR